MFDKLKQIGKLKEIQDVLLQEKFEIEREGIKVVINGKMEVEKIRLNPELVKEEQEKIIKDCLNEAMKKIQMLALEKMSDFK